MFFLLLCVQTEYGSVVQTFLSYSISNVFVQASAGGIKKDVLLGKIADLSSEKHQWIDDRLREISDLMKKASNTLEVSILVVVVA